MINLQGEWHLPGHNFTGPGTDLKYRLEQGQDPVNKVDALSLHHDMRYEFYGDNPFEVFRADVQYIGGAIGIVFSPRSSMRERGEAVLVGGIMTMKVVVSFVNPFNKFKQAQRLYKKSKSFKPLEAVM